LQLEATFKDGKKEGQARFYDENGKLSGTVEYKNDSPISGICHDCDGVQRPLTKDELSEF